MICSTHTSLFVMWCFRILSGYQILFLFYSDLIICYYCDDCCEFVMCTTWQLPVKWFVIKSQVLAWLHTALLLRSYYSVFSVYLAVPGQIHSGRTISFRKSIYDIATATYSAVWQKDEGRYQSSEFYHQDLQHDSMFVVWCFSALHCRLSVDR